MPSIIRRARGILPSGVQRGWAGTCRRGIPVEHPAIDDLDIAKLTDRPRKYGLHGTVKAPFELTKASTEAQLAEGIATFLQRSGTGTA